MSKIKILDLFSGIGGFALGLDSTGFFKTVKFVEMDKYCQKVLQKNFPNIPIEEDIKNVKGKEYEADVLVGGFPCQPFSVAGKQKGTNDDRYLWPEMLRLIREIKPEFVIGENVQGIINLQNGMVLRQVQNDLESEGFEVQCFLIPASGIGAWHQRYRVWIVGHSEHNGSLTSKIKRRNTETTTGTQEGTNTTGEPARTSGSRDNEDVSNTDSNGEKWDKSEDGQGSRVEQDGKDDVSNTNNTRGRASKHGIEREGQKTDKRWEGQPQFESSGHSKDVSNTDSGLRRGWRTIEQSGENKVWRFYSEEEEQTRLNIRSKTIGRDAVSGEEETDVADTNEQRTQVSTEGKYSGIEMSGSSSKETWWQTQSDLCGVPDGISYGLDKDRASRIKTLGNAIVPQIARELGLAIKKVINEDTNI